MENAAAPQPPQLVSNFWFIFGFGKWAGCVRGGKAAAATAPAIGQPDCNGDQWPGAWQIFITVRRDLVSRQRPRRLANRLQPRPMARRLANVHHGEAGLGFLATAPAVGQSDFSRGQWPGACLTFVVATAAALGIRIRGGSSLAAAPRSRR